MTADKPTRQIGIRFSARTLNRLEEEAQREDRAVAYLVKRIVDAHFARENETAGTARRKSEK